MVLRTKRCVGIGIFISEFKIYISKLLSNQLSVFTAKIGAVITPHSVRGGIDLF